MYNNACKKNLKMNKSNKLTVVFHWPNGLWQLLKDAFYFVQERHLKLYRWRGKWRFEKKIIIKFHQELCCNTQKERLRTDCTCWRPNHLWRCFLLLCCLEVSAVNVAPVQLTFYHKCMAEMIKTPWILEPQLFVCDQICVIIPILTVPNMYYI